jgi:nitroreductase
MMVSRESRQCRHPRNQNLYLSCEAVVTGTCAIAAYDQEAMAELLRIDGTDEFMIYMVPAGKGRAVDSRRPDARRSWQASGLLKKGAC